MFFSFMQAYFRQGVALQYLGRHADALAAFASGLAQDPKSLQLLVGMVEAAMKSPLRGRLCFIITEVILCLIHLIILSAYCTTTQGRFIQTEANEQHLFVTQTTTLCLKVVVEES